MPMRLDVATTLPADGTAGTLVGRGWRPDVEGPAVVAVRADGVHDISRAFPTMRDLAEARDPARAAAAVGEPIGDLAALIANTRAQTRDPAKPWLITPSVLQTSTSARLT